MTENWEKAVAEASDAIGEMLVETAEGKQTYSYDEIARAALRTGIATVLEEGPGEARVAEAAKVIYQKLHDPERRNWAALSEAERGFWINIAQAATSASDGRFVEQAQRLF